MFKVLEVKNKKTWESFLSKPEIIFYPFFQSWNWGKVQEDLGFKVWRFGVYKKAALVAICQVVKVKAKRGHYLHLRHGPVLFPFDQSAFNSLLAYIKDLGIEEKTTFIRMSPVVKKEHANLEMLKKLGFLSAPMHNMDAEICWTLDITKPEDELLKEMRKTHRYLIKKASTLAIELVHTNPDSIGVDVDNFLNLYSHLSERRHFVPHKGLKEEFETFAKDGQAILLLAKYKHKIICGAIIAFVGNMAIYRHGASDEAYRNIPASYLLQWEAIKEAKKRGKTVYNFWGIAPTEAKNHPWQGLTLFKTGFGGKKEEFLHAQDLPLSPLYWKTYLIESITKWHKGY